MKFGFSLPILNLYKLTANEWEKGAGPEWVIRIAQRAEELGYEWVGFTDHVIMPKEWEEVFGSRWTDPLSAMSFVAGATRRIRFLSFIMILPYRNPVIAAKSIATADFLSGGRITLGVGTGHMEREFKILNVPYGDRGAMSDEYLQIMRELWTKDSPYFEGRFTKFSDICFDPKPVQKPLPVWVGGNTRIAVRRAARFGQGWLPWAISTEELASHCGYLKEQLAERGNKDPFEVIVRVDRVILEPARHDGTQRPKSLWVPSGRAETLDIVGRFRDAGATGAQVPIGRTGSPEEFLDYIEWFATEIMPEFRGKQ